jgi:branched-chain amino acid transport system permease protein
MAAGRAPAAITTLGGGDKRMTEFIQATAFGLLIGGVYALFASGLTLIFGVMKVINIAHGALLILGAFLTFTLWEQLGLDPLAAIVVTTPLMFALGWVMYSTVVRPLRGAPLSSTVLLTFGLALVLEAVMGLVWGNQSRSARPSYFDQSFDIAGIVLPKAQVFACAVAILVLTLLYLFLARTWTGRAIRAASANTEGAALVGVNIAGVSALTFAVGVATVGAAGSMVSVLYPFLPGSHYIWIARVLSIIVLGGLGSLQGAVVGAMLLGLAEVYTQTYVSTAWATAVPYVLIFLVLFLRPQGLMGTRLREDVAV